MKRLTVLLFALILSGCTTAGLMYDAATSVLVDYCAQPLVVRKATQIVVSGKTYDHSVCDVFNAELAAEAVIVKTAERIVEEQAGE